MICLSFSSSLPSYHEKIVIQKNIIDVVRYEHLNTKNCGGSRDGDGRDREHNYKNTQKARRKSVRQLAAMNFDNSSKFVTLTFRSVTCDYKNVKLCNKAFTAFIKRLKYRYPDLKYLAVIEFQDKNGRGAVHYHMLCNLPYIKKKELSDIWSYGFVKINAIDKVDHVGAYISKYMTENLDDERLCGLKAYQYSRNLEKPVEVNSWASDKQFYFDVHDFIEKSSPTYCVEYVSEHSGTVQLLQFKL